MKSVTQMLEDFLKKSEEYINDNPQARSGDKHIEACWTAPDGYTNIHTDNHDMQAQFEIEGKWPDRIREGWGFA